MIVTDLLHVFNLQAFCYKTVTCEHTAVNSYYLAISSQIVGHLELYKFFLYLMNRVLSFVVQALLGVDERELFILSTFHFYLFFNI